MKHKRYLLKICPSLVGKTVIVTGATGTIGRGIVECCLVLGADVLMAVRNTAKAEALKEKLARKHFDVTRVSIAELEASSPESINKFVKSLPEKAGYYLINNAGTLSGGKQYMTNFLGPMYLSVRLSERMEKIVFQSSLSYRWRKSRTDWSDVQSNKVRTNMKRYARSKRLLNTTAVALNNPKFCLVHPGICSTNIIPTRLLQVLCRPIFHSARTAALPAVIALSKPVPQTHILAPRLFGIWGKPKLRRMQKSLFKAEELGRAKANFENELSKISDVNISR